MPPHRRHADLPDPANPSNADIYYRLGQVHEAIQNMREQFEAMEARISVVEVAQANPGSDHHLTPEEIVVFRARRQRRALLGQGFSLNWPNAALSFAALAFSAYEALHGR